MYYGIYSRIRNGAWKCLNDFEITSLPISVMKIAKAADVRMVKNSSVFMLEGNERAAAVILEDNWTILYDDQAPVELLRYSIAHELGHIFLGHETAKVKYTRTERIKKTAASEKHADSFAARLLCPACVIWALELESPEEIAEYCKVDYSLAKSRYERMKVLKKRDRFLTDSQEKELFERFKPYIDAERKKRGK